MLCIGRLSRGTGSSLGSYAKLTDDRTILIGMPRIDYTVEVIAKDVPEVLMGLLVGEARHRDVTVPELASSILAADFQVERNTSDLPFRRNTDSASLTMTVPVRLRLKIRRRAFDVDGTMRGVIVASLAKHFGMDAPTDRRPRGG